MELVSCDTNMYNIAMRALVCHCNFNNDNFLTILESLTIIVSLAAIEVADVTAGITATAVFSCDVTGAGGVDVCYFWTQTRNGVFPEERFPAVIYEDRIIGLRTPTLMIPNLSGLEQDFDYTCTVSIGGMRIGSGTGTLTSPGVYSAWTFVCLQ